MKKLLKISVLFWSVFLFNVNSCFANGLPTATPTTFGHAGLNAGKVITTPPVENCKYVSQEGDCRRCVEGNGSWTVFGCLSHNPTDFAAFILRFSLGIGGGAAFLAVILGSFYLLTSAGNPGKIKSGKEIITYALIGLLLIVFSIFILELVGVRILGIPGFGE